VCRPNTPANLGFEGRTRASCADRRQELGSSGLPTWLGSLPRWPIDGAAHYIVTDDGGGYETSNEFVRYSLEEDEPARLFVPEKHRTAFEAIVGDLLSASSAGKLVLVFEENGHVTSTDLTPEEVETIDVVGLLGMEEFWRLLDLGEVLEDSVVVVEGLPVP
jgi:hypothetical protein